MAAISATDIISIIKSEIENFDTTFEAKEVGQVISVGDGIARIYGIDHALYGEIVVFENGVKNNPLEKHGALSWAISSNKLNDS